ncbi:MAG: hypothetical protein EOM90_10305 [Alphaproteobacteria bacterium]|nr:hypothetical protein [Alphaproteobacteria bacterium]
MKNQKNFVAVVLCILVTVMMMGMVPSLAAQDKGSFKDSRDNRIYQWIKVGKKVWMAENLKYLSSSGSWLYNNESGNEAIYGRLYTHATAMTSCPKGWRLPADIDFDAMIRSLGGNEAAGGKLQAVDSIYWAANTNLPENAKTLSSLLAGVRHADSTFTGVGIWGGLWSATRSGDAANNYLFVRGDKGIGKSSNDIQSAFSVRCVKK